MTDVVRATSWNKLLQMVATEEKNKNRCCNTLKKTNNQVKPVVVVQYL